MVETNYNNNNNNNNNNNKYDHWGLLEFLIALLSVICRVVFLFTISVVIAYTSFLSHINEVYGYRKKMNIDFICIFFHHHC